MAIETRPFGPNATAYGDGASERNLGTALRAPGSPDALVGTKVRLRPAEFSRIAAAVAERLDGSLRRVAGLTASFAGERR